MIQHGTIHLETGTGGVCWQGGVKKIRVLNYGIIIIYKTSSYSGHHRQPATFLYSASSFN